MEEKECLWETVRVIYALEFVLGHGHALTISPMTNWSEGGQPNPARYVALAEMLEIFVHVRQMS